MKKNRSVCVCIAGWHYPKEIFSDLSEIKDIDLFIVSHRPIKEIPEYVFSFLPKEHIFVEPNYGYDWGCYQQFLEKEYWLKYEYIIFMHDDMVIKDTGFVDAGIELLKEFKVIGNGRMSNPRDWPSSHPESYYHYQSLPFGRAFVHDVVRGSFFMTTNDVISKLCNFEVFWDRLKASSYYGNWSTRASCAKLQYQWGDDCFGFFANEQFESEWLNELVRGQEDSREINETLGVYKKAIAHTIYSVSKWYMKRAWDKKASFISSSVRPLLKFFASRPKNSLAE